jgi:hypothetical protein
MQLGFGSLSELKQGNLFQIACVVAGIGFGYVFLVFQRETQLREWTTSICDVFEKNALPGSKAAQEFPKDVALPRVLTPILASVVSYGYFSIAFNEDVHVVLSGSVFVAFGMLLTALQSQRDFDASEKLKNVYEALLKSGFSTKHFAPPERSLGFWRFPPTFFPFILYVVLLTAFKTAEKLGVSVEHAAEINFWIPAAACVVYYVIKADISRQIRAEEECYRAANEALDLRKYGVLEKVRRFFF